MFHSWEGDEREERKFVLINAAGIALLWLLGLPDAALFWFLVAMGGWIGVGAGIRTGRKLGKEKADARWSAVLEAEREARERIEAPIRQRENEELQREIQKAAFLADPHSEVGRKFNP